MCEKGSIKGYVCILSEIYNLLFHNLLPTLQFAILQNQLLHISISASYIFILTFRNTLSLPFNLYVEYGTAHSFIKLSFSTVFFIKLLFTPLLISKVYIDIYHFIQLTINGNKISTNWRFKFMFHIFFFFLCKGFLLVHHFIEYWFHNTIKEQR